MRGLGGEPVGLKNDSARGCNASDKVDFIPRIFLSRAAVAAGVIFKYLSRCNQENKAKQSHGHGDR